MMKKSGGRNIADDMKAARFLLDGFPRSGNTFATNFVSAAFPGVNFLHHYHNLAALKAAKEASIPRFVLIREPSEAISSLILLHANLQSSFRFPWLLPSSKSFKVDLYLKRYIVMYSNLLSENDVMFFPTHIVFEDPHKLIHQISEVIDFSPSLIGARNAIAEYFQKKEAQAEHRPLTMGVPNAEKNRVKDDLMKIISEHPRYLDAVQIYRQIYNVNNLDFFCI